MLEGFRTILHRYSNKNNTTLAQKRHVDQWHKVEDLNKGALSK